nr:hypothetical protein [Lachnospiraceae bacterium]
MGARPKRSRIWEIQSQLYDTYGNPYIDPEALHNRGLELIDADKVNEFCWIIHNRCVYTKEEEEEAAKEIAAGINRKQIIAGDKKPEHLHFEIQLKEGASAETVADMFGVTTAQIVYVRENKLGETQTFEDKCAYLCHHFEPNKTPYDYSEIHATFDYAKMCEEYGRRQAKKNKSKHSKAFRDEHVNKISSGEETLPEFIAQYGYATYEENKSHYDHAYEYFLSTKYQGEGFRLTYFITGPSTVGKTPLAKFYACSMFPEIENPREVFFCPGDSGGTFQSYRGQPVIIWDDWRAVDFIREFGREKLLSSLFAVHPEPVDFNVKYGTAVLRHTVNIITCIDDIDRFTKELSGKYTDKNNNKHKGEEGQILQFFKRIFSFTEVTEDSITFAVNAGYMSRLGNVPLYYYKQYVALAKIGNNTARIAENVKPSLYGHVGSNMLPELKTTYDEQLERERAKIDRVEDIPADLLPSREYTFDGNMDNAIIIEPAKIVRSMSELHEMYDDEYEELCRRRKEYGVEFWSFKQYLKA